MGLRVGVAALAHETNTYADASTGPTDYERFEVRRGDEFVKAWKDTAMPPAGMMDAIEALDGAEVVPLYSAFAQPSGTIKAPAYQRLREELLDSIRQAPPLDALGLSLHGAAVAEGIDDIEADLVRAVRELIGRGTPLVGALDLHGNISQEMADIYDAFFGFHLYPHEDMYERGVEAIELIPRLLDNSLSPVTHVEHVPMLIPASTTDSDPAAEANRICREIESRPGIIDCTLFHGFPYADVPLAGMSVVAIADGDVELARSAAREMGTWVWEHRQDFLVDHPSAEVAVAQALQVEGRPVVINEASDNTGGGAPGDGTHLLRAMMDAGLHDACFGCIFDPGVAAQAHEAGPGNSIEVELGGKHDDLHGDPIRTSAYVKTLSDGRFVLQAWAPGLALDLGKSARLVIGGIDVIVVSRQSQVFDPTVFILHGIQVESLKIVGLKSSQHFRAGYRALAAEIITADTPGVTTSHVELFERRRNRVPLWPLDDSASYK